MKHIKLFESFQDQLNKIDSKSKEDAYKYYVGYIKRGNRRGPFAWTHDGRFKGFNSHKESLDYIEDLKMGNIPDNDIRIFSEEEYKEIEKKRRQ